MSGQAREMERQTQRTAFLAEAGWADARQEALTGDASFRRYWRLRRGDERAILMDAPPGREDVSGFIAVAWLLARAGLSAPAIHHVVADTGFVLLEDFGDDTFTRLLDRGEDAHDLYALAVDALIHLQRSFDPAAHPEIRRLEAPALLDQAGLLTEWYLPLATGQPTDDSAARSWRDIWNEMLAARPEVPETLILYDYHVDNLMRLPGRSGVAACGLLDFQDAVLGPPLFDLVSLLRDVRRDVPVDLDRAMRARYAQGMADSDDAAFAHGAALWALQRNCRILGTFARLCVRDGKPGYLRFLPRVWRLVMADAAHPALRRARDWLNYHVPAAARRIDVTRIGRQTGAQTGAHDG